MTTYTTHLIVPHLGQNVAEPEIPVNEMMNIFDAAICGQLSMTAAGMIDDDYTLDDTSLSYPQEWQYGILLADYTCSAGRSIFVPDGKKMKYVLDNTSSQTITLITESGNGIAVPNGSIYHLYSDGIDIKRIT